MDTQFAKARILSHCVSNLSLLAIRNGLLISSVVYHENRQATGVLQSK